MKPIVLGELYQRVNICELPVYVEPYRTNIIGPTTRMLLETQPMRTPFASHLFQEHVHFVGDGKFSWPEGMEEKHNWLRKIWGKRIEIK